jgi:hypothetical protein
MKNLILVLSLLSLAACTGEVLPAPEETATQTITEPTPYDVTCPGALVLCGLQCWHNDDAGACVGVCCSPDAGPTIP